MRIKELFFPALAGLDEIAEANISPIDKLELLKQWNEPHASHKALKELRQIITTLQQYYDGELVYSGEALGK